MKTLFCFLFLLFLSHFSAVSQTIPPTISSSRPATAKEKVIFKELPEIFKEDQRLRGEVADVALALRSKAKDSTEKAQINHLVFEIFDVQEQYIDRYSIKAFLTMIDKGGFFNGFIYGKDTLKSQDLLLHVPMGRKDSTLRQDVKKMLDKEFKAERLGMTAYAVTLWQLNFRKGNFKDYFSTTYIKNPNDKNRMYYLIMD